MGTPVYSAFAREQRLASLDGPGNPLLTGHATYSSASATITLAAAIPGLKPGYLAINQDLASGVFVVSVSGTTVVLSGMPSAAGSGVFIAFVPAPATLSGLDIHLFQSPISVNYNTPLATLVAAEATFDGYTDLTLLMNLGYINPLGQQVARSQLLTWLMTGSTTPNTIYGYWTDDGTNWWTAEVFPAPYAMPTLGAELDCVLQDSQPEAQGIIILAA